MKYLIVLLAVVPLVFGIEVPFPKESILNMEGNNDLQSMISDKCNGIKNFIENQGTSYFEKFEKAANKLEDAYNYDWGTFLARINDDLDMSEYCSGLFRPVSIIDLKKDLNLCLDMNEKDILSKILKLWTQVIIFFCNEEGSHFLQFLASEAGKNWRNEQQSVIEMCWNESLSGYQPQPGNISSILLLDFAEHMVQCNTLDIFESCIVSNLMGKGHYEASSNLENLYLSLSEKGVCMKKPEITTTTQILETTTEDITTTSEIPETTEQSTLLTNQPEILSSVSIPVQNSLSGSSSRKNGLITTLTLSGALTMCYFFGKIV